MCPESIAPVPASIRSRLPDALQATFADPTIIQSLATGHGSDTLKALGDIYSECEPVQFEATFKVLIDAAAADEPSWGTGERDAILAVANQLSTTITTDPAIRSNRLFNHYIATVSSLETGSDYFGAPHSLYEIGTVLASAAGRTTNQAESYETRMKVRDAWSGFFTTIPDDNTREVSKSLIENLVTKILPVRITESKTFEWSRAQPDMKEKSQALHDSFLREVKDAGTFKSRLYGETPRFQEEMAKHKLTLANYWNVTDPQAIAEGVNALSSSLELDTVAQQFSKSFSAKYQLDLVDLIAHPEIAGILADEIQAEMQVILDHMRLAVRPPEDTFMRLLEQTETAKTASKPMRKIRPVINLLESMGLSGARSANDVEKLLTEDLTRSIILETLRLQTNKTQERISLIGDLFPPAPYKYLTLMSRQESDLYAADDTRDCTAYHLTNGFNGWTLPHWLANPGFNMAYIHDDEGRVAKIGLFLAVDERGPRLVIDSIETSKNITPVRNNSALFAIHGGLQELQTWADNQSLGDVIFCTYTNSQELALELPVTPPSEPPIQLAPLGSTVGLQEYWATVAGNKREVISLGYLQSQINTTQVDIADNFVGINHDQEYDFQDALRALEATLSEANSDRLDDAARSGNWEAVVCEYVRCQLPMLHKVFGDNTKLYVEPQDSIGSLLDMILYQQLDFTYVEDFITGRVELSEYDSEDNVERAEILDFGRSFIERAPVIATDPFLSVEDCEELQYQANEMTKLGAIMDRLSRYTDPDIALRRIYGNQADQINITLRLNMPILKRGL